MLTKEDVAARINEICRTWLIQVWAKKQSASTTVTHLDRLRDARSSDPRPYHRAQYPFIEPRSDAVRDNFDDTGYPSASNGFFTEQNIKDFRRHRNCLLKTFQTKSITENEVQCVFTAIDFMLKHDNCAPLWIKLDPAMLPAVLDVLLLRTQIPAEKKSPASQTMSDTLWQQVLTKISSLSQTLAGLLTRADVNETTAKIQAEHLVMPAATSAATKLITQKYQPADFGTLLNSIGDTKAQQQPLTSAAHAGNLQAQLYLTNHYFQAVFYDSNNPLNIYEAWHYAYLAAQQNSEEAWRRLAHMLSDTRFAYRNIELAIACYRKLPNDNDSEAIINELTAQAAVQTITPSEQIKAAAQTALQHVVQTCKTADQKTNPANHQLYQLLHDSCPITLNALCSFNDPDALVTLAPWQTPTAECFDKLALAQGNFFTKDALIQWQRQHANNPLNRQELSSDAIQVGAAGVSSALQSQLQQYMMLYSFSIEPNKLEQLNASWLTADGLSLLSHLSPEFFTNESKLPQLIAMSQTRALTTGLIQELMPRSDLTTLDTAIDFCPLPSEFRDQLTAASIPQP